jgi:hypothetical protein
MEKAETDWGRFRFFPVLEMDIELPPEKHSRLAGEVGCAKRLRAFPVFRKYVQIHGKVQTQTGDTMLTNGLHKYDLPCRRGRGTEIAKVNVAHP